MADLKELANKGNGILVRHGNVWSYTGVEYDRSGTNLRLPIEYVSDKDVQEAMNAGDFHPAVYDLAGVVSAVRMGDAAAFPPAVTASQVGTPDAGTELPLNSRPTHDAAKATPKEVEAAAAAKKAPAKAPPAPAPAVPAAAKL